MTLCIARAVYLAAALGAAILSHLILQSVAQYRDGKSQLALLVWFRAMRVYGVLLAANMAANIVIGGGSHWGLVLSAIGAIYLAYALIVFYRTVR